MEYEHVFGEGSGRPGRNQPWLYSGPLRHWPRSTCAGGGIGRRARLRALWAEWPVEVRVLFGAWESPAIAGFFVSGARRGTAVRRERLADAQSRGDQRLGQRTGGLAAGVDSAESRRSAGVHLAVDWRQLDALPVRPASGAQGCGRPRRRPQAGEEHAQHRQGVVEGLDRGDGRQGRASPRRAHPWPACGRGQRLKRAAGQPSAARAAPSRSG